MSFELYTVDWGDFGHGGQFAPLVQKKDCFLYTAGDNAIYIYGSYIRLYIIKDLECSIIIKILFKGNSKVPHYT